MNSQEMIDSYVHEVGQQLPRKMRADIELELRSLLADAVEAREGDEETAVIEFLTELGSPTQFAAQYLPNQYLVGPELFPTFKLVGTIVFSVLTILTAATMGFVIVRYGTPENFLSWWGQEMAEYSRNLVFAFGMITLVFVALEHLGAGKVDAQEAWDPKSLRPVQDPTRISRSDLIGELVGALFTIWFVFQLPNWIGVEGGGIFTAGFLVHVPWIVAGSVADIMLNGTVLVNGRWDKTSRIFQVALQMFDMYVLYRIITGVALINFETIDTLVKASLGIALVVLVIDTIIKIFRLVTAQQQPVAHHRSKTA